MRRNQDDKDTVEIKEIADVRGNRDQRIHTLEEQVKLMSYALSNVLKVIQDVTNIKTQVEMMYYRTLGILKVIEKNFGADTLDMVDNAAQDARIETFNELSNRDDKERSLRNVDDTLVEERDVVIFTSTCTDDPGASVLRSKIGLDEQSLADAKNSFIGRSVGDVFTLDVNKQIHQITLLGIRRV